MRSALTAAIATSVILPASAVAEPARAPRPTAAADVSRMVTDDCALARRLGKTCVLEVPPEDVQGDTPGARSVDIRILRFGTAGSLIRLRRDFVFEIVKTAEDL